MRIDNSTLTKRSWLLFYGPIKLRCQCKGGGGCDLPNGCEVGEYSDPVPAGMFSRAAIKSRREDFGEANFPEVTNEFQCFRRIFLEAEDLRRHQGPTNRRPLTLGNCIADLSSAAKRRY